jgi:hypothetical protein
MRLLRLAAHLLQAGMAAQTPRTVCGRRHLVRVVRVEQLVVLAMRAQLAPLGRRIVSLVAVLAAAVA